MPSRSYQHNSINLWKQHQEEKIDDNEYSASLEQIKIEEIAHQKRRHLGFLTPEQKEIIENDIWNYENEQRKWRESVARRKAEIERRNALSPLERYKEDVSLTIEQYREEANRYRRIANRLQGFIIIGSVLVTSATSAAGIEFGGIFKWLAIIFSISVAISAGFTGYFKFRERSFNLQQTADNIEQEFTALEIGIGYYKGIQEQEKALVLFAERIEHLKEEQKKRQQQLEQPPDLRHVQSYV